MSCVPVSLCLLSVLCQLLHHLMFLLPSVLGVLLCARTLWHFNGLLPGFCAPLQGGVLGAGLGKCSYSLLVGLCASASCHCDRTPEVISVRGGGFGGSSLLYCFGPLVKQHWLRTRDREAILSSRTQRSSQHPRQAEHNYLEV